MKKWPLLVLTMFMGKPAIHAQEVLSLTAPSQPIVFAGVNVIRPGSETILTDQIVIVENGKIKELGRAGRVKIPTSSLAIDGAGKYLLPGLAEMHAHIPAPEANGDLSMVKQTLFLYLCRGVTTLRGMLGQPFHLNLKEKLAKQGITNMPVVYTSSPSFNGNSVPDVSTAEKLVKQYQSEGYDFLKIHPGIKVEVYDALTRTAKQVGIPFAGHVPVEVGVRHAIQSGQLTIDHLDGYIEAMAPPLADLNQNGFFGFNLTDQADVNKIKGLADLTKQKGTWLVPTQTLFTRWFSPEDPAAMMRQEEMAYMPSRTRFAWHQSKTNLIKSAGYTAEKYKAYLDIRKKLLLDLHQSGVRLLLGSDAPQVMNVPGFSIHHEMESWAEAGIPAWKILQAGTSEVSRFFGTEKESGDIAVGQAANLILLEQNPVERIENIKTISGVMNQGIWMPKTVIEEELRKIAQANQ
ncbi:MAG TPA: amidohydrolase family protein [Saprospiraceae bacterium]|nr:amidohydrolase family protein [Saprospiraceae bacterium]HNT19617.1 amidohydrolase family protein [Saprospiraceae bacterium]